MGQQSAAMYLMSQLGIFPKLDYSIFADPGREKSETYKYLNWLIKEQKKNNWTPIIWDKSKNLYEDILNQENSTGQRFASIPAYTQSGGMIRRQCTNEYKINVVDNVIRDLQGVKKNHSFKPVNLWFGISIDELQRMFGPHRKNVTHVYPFCGYYNDGNGFKELEWGIKMNRSDINSWMKKNGYPIPPKSSCVFCPFQDDNSWLELKRNHPEDFKAAVKVDKSIRNMTKRGLTDKIYLHDSLKTLDKAEFKEAQVKMNFDCYGYCNT